MRPWTVACLPTVKSYHKITSFCPQNWVKIYQKSLARTIESADCLWNQFLSQICWILDSNWLAFWGSNSPPNHSESSSDAQEASKSCEERPGGRKKPRKCVQQAVRSCLKWRKTTFVWAPDDTSHGLIKLSENTKCDTKVPAKLRQLHAMNALTSR